MAAGLLWAGLCLALYGAGHEPSVTLVPIPADRYYLAQGIFVTPLLVGQWLLCALVATRVARAAGGSGDLWTAAGPLGLALAGPLAVLHLAPEVIAYALWGFDALGKVVRVSAPLAFAGSVVAAAVAIRRVDAVRWGAATGAAAAGVVAQLLAGGILLR